MHITKLRKIWFSISAALVATAVITISLLPLNLGLDFLGGARWDLQFKNSEVTAPKLRGFFQTQESLQKDVQIKASDNNTFLITIENLPDTKIQEISQNLTQEIGEFTQISFRKVDANIGQSFKRKSIIAICISLIGIILFVAYVFRKIPEAINPWRFGTVAILALFHDILIVLGIFVVLGVMFDVELDLTFLTALLATLGFSVNDTIVILDRVRENIRAQKAHETFEDTVEKSVQQTLARSIYTSISTLFPLIALYFLGAESISYFVLALILGITVGTYSSIFLAAPALVSLKEWSDKKDE
jgi:preprotein translocase subunit SecF